jgi:hypothetical protein
VGGRLLSSLRIAVGFFAVDFFGEVFFAVAFVVFLFGVFLVAMILSLLYTKTKLVSATVDIRRRA